MTEEQQSPIVKNDKVLVCINSVFWQWTDVSIGDFTITHEPIAVPRGELEGLLQHASPVTRGQGEEETTTLEPWVVEVAEE